MSARSRFWLVTLAAALACILTASLGRWQLGRAAEKEALQARIDAREQLPVLDALSLQGDADVEPLLYRRVEAAGEWVAERTVFLDNRPMNGRAGFYVVTPLRLRGSGTVLLVQRGWVPRDFQDRTRVPAVDTPAGVVRISGHIVPAPSRLYELGEPGSGPIRQNLDVAQFRVETGLALAPVSIQQGGDAADGLLRAWPKISTGVEKHYGYAFQWFGLSALIAALYVWFQIVRRFQRRADSAGA